MAVLVGAMVASFAFTGVAVPLLRRAQFVDIPNHRSSHNIPVPRGGGVAVVLVICALASLSGEWGPELGALIAATLVLAMVGFIDDVRSLPSRVRLVTQMSTALILATVLLAVGVVGWWWFPVLCLTIVGYVNAFNFMDGVNGISALAAAVVGGWWAWVGHEQGDELLVVLGVVLAGAAIGFLPWNAPRARVFLGDVGSYGIGAFVAGVSAVALSAGAPWQWALAPLVVYGADTGWVLLKRLRAGRPLTVAHREHVYQRLVDGGWSHLSSASMCAGAGALVCVAIGAAGRDLEWWSAVAAATVTLAYLNSPRALTPREGRR